MEFSKTKISGLYLIKPKKFEDIRGKFIKTFHKETFEAHGLNVDFVESYYSVSKKDVIRGMHFQIPPHDHEKLIYVPFGSIMDVILDIRKGSPTYGQYVTQTLSAENGYMFYIPKGCAHGFLSLEDNANVTYMQTSMYAGDHDEGILYDSFGLDWNVLFPKISKRDGSFIEFKNFISPFK